MFDRVLNTPLIQFPYLSPPTMASSFYSEKRLFHSQMLQEILQQEIYTNKIRNSGNLYLTLQRFSCTNVTRFQDLELH